jgi:hypothetical protein
VVALALGRAQPWKAGDRWLVHRTLIFKKSHCDFADILASPSAKTISEFRSDTPLTTVRAPFHADVANSAMLPCYHRPTGDKNCTFANRTERRACQGKASRMAEAD